MDQFLKPFLNFARGGFVLPVVAAALLLSLAGCYDPDPLSWLGISPDGQYAAVLTSHNELGILSLEGDGVLRIISKHAQGRAGWAPEGHRLAYVEQLPGRQPTLWLRDAGGEREPVALIQDGWWKAEPSWLSNHELAFLSDRQAEDVNVWTLDLTSNTLTETIDRTADVTRLWASPQDRTLVYQCAEVGRPELWMWSSRLGRPVQLTHDSEQPLAEDLDVAFSPVAARLAFVSRLEGRRYLVEFDSERQAVRKYLALDRPVRGIAYLGDGRIAATQGSQLLLWRPEAGWFQDTVRRVQWGGLSIHLPAAWGSRGVAVALANNIVLAAREASRLGDGRVIARRTEDGIRLAFLQARSEGVASARRTLDQFMAEPGSDPKVRFMLTAARGRLERLAERPADAVRWLEQAAQLAGERESDAEPVALEALATEFFDAKDFDATRALMGRMPSATKEDPLATWLDQAETTPSLERRWAVIGDELRQGNEESAARRLNELFSEDQVSTLSLEALGLVLNGALEPLDSAVGIETSPRPALMHQPGFQLALLRASRREAPGAGLSPSELRGLLFSQWVRQGNIENARLLALEDLNAPGASTIDYGEMLEQYLGGDELDAWIEKAIVGVLLQEQVSAGLAAKLNDPSLPGALALAEAKADLTHGKLNEAQSKLKQAKELIDQQKEETGGEAGETLLDPWDAHFMVNLLDAKIAEQSGLWAKATASYQRCLQLIERRPGSWDGWAPDLALTVDLIRHGQADGDLLRSACGIWRAVGDPFLAPSRSPFALETALTNMETLERVAPQAWLMPYLTFMKGYSLALSGRRAEALVQFRQARQFEPSAALLARILMEEAALRDLQGQHGMAARLYEKCLAVKTSAAVRAQSCVALLQAELAAGLTQDSAQRLDALLAAYPLPGEWVHWVRTQIGDGAAVQ